jgi:deoxyguanosine kinase
MIRPKKIVCVTGNIGAGKTLVARRLIGGLLDFEYHGEVVDEEVLNKFYSDMKQHGYDTQMFFLSTRYQSLHKMKIGEKSAVTDRYIDEDIEIFSTQLLKQGNISSEHYNTILKTRDAMVEAFENSLDLLIYLHADVDVLRSRIEKRIGLNPKRENERGLLDPKNNYLSELNDLYDNWFNNYEGDKLLINTNDLILSDEKGESPLRFGHIEETLNTIENHLYS